MLTLILYRAIAHPTSIFPQAVLIPPSYPLIAFNFSQTIFMLFATSLTAFAVLASSAVGAPTDSLLSRDSPTIIPQVTTQGETYYYRGCYDELKRELLALQFQSIL